MATVYFFKFMQDFKELLTETLVLYSLDVVIQGNSTPLVKFFLAFAPVNKKILTHAFQRVAAYGNAQYVELIHRASISPNSILTVRLAESDQATPQTEENTVVHSQEERMLLESPMLFSPAQVKSYSLLSSHSSRPGTYTLNSNTAKKQKTEPSSPPPLPRLRSPLPRDVLRKRVIDFLYETNESGTSPVHLAARSLSLETLRYLVEIMNFKVDIVTTGSVPGLSPLHFALSRLSGLLQKKKVPLDDLLVIVQYLVLKQNLRSENTNEDPLKMIDNVLHLSSTNGLVSSIKTVIENPLYYNIAIGSNTSKPGILLGTIWDLNDHTRSKSSKLHNRLPQCLLPEPPYSDKEIKLYFIALWEMSIKEFPKIPPLTPVYIKHNRQYYSLTLEEETVAVFNAACARVRHFEPFPKRRPESIAWTLNEYVAEMGLANIYKEHTVPFLRKRRFFSARGRN